jgi:hypothetical protein
MAGAFFKDAQNEAENKGNVIVFCAACEESKLTVDGSSISRF